MDKWIKLSDRHPEIGKAVLGTNGEIMMVVVMDTEQLFDPVGIGGCEWEDEFDDPTHWMELPDFPEKKEAEKK